MYLFTNLLSLFTIFLFTLSCEQTPDTAHMLQDPGNRQEIFSHIAGDQNMMNDFINHMDAAQRGMMMSNPEMRDMMANDPEMAQHMMQNMMNDGKMMQQRGMDSDHHMMSQ